MNCFAKSITVALSIAAFAQAFAQTAPLPAMQEIPLKQIHITGGFWGQKQRVNQEVSIPHALDMLEKTGDLHNFELAAAGAKEGYKGYVFQDSDTYKVLESAALAMATHPDPALDKRVDAIIAKLAAAQQPDGYLNTYYTVKEPGKRFTNLRDNHELYCAGHLFEAAVAHFKATGKRNLLNIATKYADLLAATFGTGPGKRMGYCGHPESELALYKLWKLTGKQDYIQLARFFIENRGTHFFALEHNTPEDQYDGTYFLDDVPICEHDKMEGHAVRAAYLMSGAADIGSVTDNQAMLAMVNKVWNNCTERNLFITGGIGPSGSNEGFTHDYDLPNASAYQETCASVAMMMWDHRLNMLYGDGKYVDLMEQALYNGVLSGVSQDGAKFFYVNPLASSGSHHRQDWFGCACCPPNVTRTIAELGYYAYATSPDALWVNLFVQGSVEVDVAGGKAKFDVKTDYPWSGAVNIHVGAAPTRKFDVRLRVPGWCQGATVKVNGSMVSTPLDKGYFVVSREWKSGDTVDLDLPLPARQVAANPNVVEDRNMLALARGPIIYCLEACDNASPLEHAAIPEGLAIKAKSRPDLLGGITVLEGDALAGSGDWPGGLYHSLEPAKRFKFTAVPYYAWDNRKAGAMRVWMPTSPATPKIRGVETSAKVTLSHVSGYAQPNAVKDGNEPKSSGEQPGALCHFWPRKGTSDDWVQYAWDQPVTVSSARVYWFDDTGRGECRLPESWRLEYKDGDTWKPVKLTNPKAGFGIGLDHWCEVDFERVNTTAIRLEFKMKSGWSVGVHAWQVFDAGR